MAWRIYAAASIGSSHIEAGTPCQDAFAHALVGDTMLGVVCDGAGSQALSHVGAQAVSSGVVARLQQLELGEAPLSARPDVEFARAVGDAVAQVREGLQKEASNEGVEISAFSCTLVGAVATARGGRFFHIGDGLAVAEHADAPSVVSLPENGEYANETYFVSGEQWHEHLRYTAFGESATRIALMSDGAMPFAMAKGNGGLFKPFMDPVEGYLASVSEEEGSAALAGTLGDPRTYTITSDDKTLLIALWR
jgi:serine/threonine protein phosphatase PrpC